MTVLKNITLLLVVFLSLGGSLLEANGIKNKIIIDPQYLATTDELNCGKVKSINVFTSQITYSLQDYFKKQGGYKVIVTNDTKTYIEDNKRSKTANDCAGDILISISVFCPEDNKEANIEIVNSMIEFKEASEKSTGSKNVFRQEDILNDLKQDSLRIFNEGAIVGRSIQRKIAQENLNINKEIKFEPVDVLIGVNMPATLIRIPYLGNVSGDYIDRLVASIYAGVNEFWHQ